MNNTLFIGASLDNNKKFILGQHMSSFSKTAKKGEDDTASTYTFLEVGPRFHWYFTQERTAFLAFAYNPYLKGTSNVSEVDSTTNGSSILVAFGYHVKTSSKSALGASLVYHSSTVTSVVTDNEEEETTNTFVSISPYLEFVGRF